MKIGRCNMIVDDNNGHIQRIEEVGKPLEVAVQNIVNKHTRELEIIIHK